MPKSGAARWISEGIDWPKTCTTPWRFSEAAKSWAAERLLPALMLLIGPTRSGTPDMAVAALLAKARLPCRLLTWKIDFRNGFRRQQWGGRDMDRYLDGRGAVVTGGASGQGRAIALALAARGASVAIGSYLGKDAKMPSGTDTYLPTADELAKVRAEIEAHGVRAVALPLDV